MKLTATVLVTLALAATAYGQERDATVTVYRPYCRFVGIALSPSIYSDGIELQRLHNGTVFTATLPPGKHMITAGRSEVGQFVDFEPGQKYFFRFGHKNWAGT